VRDNPTTGVSECETCGLVTPSEDLSRLVDYSAGTMHDWAVGWGGEITGPKDDSNRRLEAIHQLEEQFRFRSILDYGCGKGEMLSQFSSRYKTYGVEPDTSARKFATQRIPSASIFDSYDSAQNHGVQVEAITLFHVIEHFYLPSLELGNIRNLLRPEGLLIIETPNSFDALLTDYECAEFQNFTYWSHHPMLHSRKSLELLLERNRFRVLQGEGAQRYSLSNHLYWLSKAAPGGHVIWKDRFTDETLKSYAQDLIKSGGCDTLWLVAQKID
jgi:SAM-dependent methyltransferase